MTKYYEDWEPETIVIWTEPVLMKLKNRRGKWVRSQIIMKEFRIMVLPRPATGEEG